MIANLKPYPQYKESGLPWLGQVPKHWSKERAKRLFTRMERPVGDEDDVVTCFRDGTVTLRRNRRLRGFTEAIYEFGYQGIRRGDLVIHAMDAFAGAVGVSDRDGKGTPVYAVCQPRPGVNAHYYAFIVREMARSQWILALSRGIRERSTDFRYDMFGGQPVPLPPPDEQAAIVRFLNWANGRLEWAIRAKRKVIALLNEQKQAIIHRAVTRGLESCVPFKPSGLPGFAPIPAHWKVLALKRVLLRLIDCEHKTAPVVDDSEYRVVRTTGVRHGFLHLHGTYCTTALAFRQWTRRGLAEPGDVIFTREAPAGEACLVPMGISLCLGQRTVLMKLQRNLVDPEFLVHLVYAGSPRAAITLASQGSTVGHFNMSDIGSLRIFLPPIDEQVRIVHSVAPGTRGLDQAISRHEREIKLFHEYRARLVADVVTGKLDVREAAVRLRFPLIGDSIQQRGVGEAVNFSQFFDTEVARTGGERPRQRHSRSDRHGQLPRGKEGDRGDRAGGQRRGDRASADRRCQPQARTRNGSLEQHPQNIQ